MLVYIAGPYRPLHDRTTEENIAIAREIAVRLWDIGHTPFCPHLNSAGMEKEFPGEEEMFIRGDLVMLARCDAIVMLNRWEESSGAKREFAYAKELGIPIYYASASYLLPPLHPTEQHCPEQCKAFAEVLGQMYRLHLSKNEDYSPANVQGTCEVGVTVRLWDKLARLMNLGGYKVEIQESRFEPTPEIMNIAAIWSKVTKILFDKGFRVKAIAQLVSGKEPKHETVEDCYLDAANYSVIGLLLRRGLWGR